MRIGVVYPQTEYPTDPLAVRDYAQAVEGLGYTHILAYEHVLGANPDRPGGWRGPYTYQHPFHEPFVLFSFLAAITRVIEFTTGIVILPQRQAVLVAKQAASLDVLSNGRLRLGVGLGWNRIEFTALNEDFHTRGRRIEEQVSLLRQLWTEPLVKFDGRWHSVEDAGLNPMPVQQPIPIWFGGDAEAAVKRAARLGDGWMPLSNRVEDVRPSLDLVNRTLQESGRDPDSFGLDVRIPYGDGDPDAWKSLLQQWQSNRATHISVNMMGCGFASPQQHMAALANFAKELGLA